MSQTRTESEQTTEYFNFINSLNSEATKKQYAYCLQDFLNYCNNIDLHSFLILTLQEKEKLIIEYLVQKKVSASYKNAILSTMRHACVINDVVLNWTKIRKFIRSSQKTGNEIAGRDRGYEHPEIQKILQHSEQRIKTAFLILASTGVRIGALAPLKIGDLEKISDLYKVTVYSGEKEQYVTFTTPECAKEIDAYLEFRRHRGEVITRDSYVLVKKFKSNVKSEPFKGYSLRSVLQDNIENTGLKEIGSKWKRKETPLLHAFRKFFTKQLVDSKVNPEIREMLLGHKIGLAGAYYRPTEQEMLTEYYKAVSLLTISNEERLKFKLEERIQIEKTKIESLTEKYDKLMEEVTKIKEKERLKWSSKSNHNYCLLMT